MQNFTLYTETDPNSHITVTSSSKIDFTSLPRNEDAYVYRDCGANFFSGNVSIDFELQVDSGDNFFNIYTCVIANAINDFYGIDTANDSALGVAFYKDSSTTGGIQLKELDSGTVYNATAYAISLSTTYYCTFVRDESVGTYGTLYLYIYSDTGRTNLLNTQTLTLNTSKKDFRYLYALQTYNSAHTNAGTGFVQNFGNIDGFIDASCATATLTAYSATVNAALNITATTASCTLTGHKAFITPLVMNTASLILTAYGATVNAALNITAITATCTLTAYSATIDLVWNVSATTASLTLTTYDATVEFVSGQATTLIVSNFPQGATVEYKIHDAVSGLLQDWTSVGVSEVQGPTKSAYYFTTSVIGITTGTSGVVYWRTSDLAYEASEAYDFVNIGLTLARALSGGIAKESSVQAIPTTPLLAADYTAPDNAGIAALPLLSEMLAGGVAKEATLATAQADITSVLNYAIAMSKWKNNKLERTAVNGNTETWVLYDDDSSTPLLTYQHDTSNKSRAKAT